MPTRFQSQHHDDQKKSSASGFYQPCRDATQYQTDYQRLIEYLADDIIEQYSQRPASHRLLVAISGIPGSGKTTIASSIVYSINVKIQLRMGCAIAASVPMDGYHYTRAQLDDMKNPEEAHTRRGAPFTFDAVGFNQLVHKLKGPVIKPQSAGDVGGGGGGSILKGGGSSSVGGGVMKAEWVKAPSFDHAVKDPEVDGITILPSQRILVFEGNYLSMTNFPDQFDQEDWTAPQQEWKEIAASFDKSIFIDTPKEITRERLARRHLEAGIAKTMAEAEIRAGGSDARNADDILRWRGKVDIVVNGSDFTKTRMVFEMDESSTSSTSTS